MSALSVALVPMLASHLAHERREEMHQLLSRVILIASLFFGCVSLLLALFFSKLAPLFVSFQGESLELYIEFGQLACLTNLLFVLGNAYGQYLITRQTYVAYGITPILYTLGTIAGTIWLSPAIGVHGPMVGTVIGAVLYTLVRALAARRLGFTFRITQSPSSVILSSTKDGTSGMLFNSEIREIGVLMFPRMIALGALQFQLLFFDKIASGLSLGSVTINAYARNFQAAAVGIIGVALAQSAYSLLSQAIARGEVGRFWVYLRKGLGLGLGLGIQIGRAHV